MTISTIGNNGLALTSPLPVLQGGTGFVDGTPMFRNRIINGGMVIDQRNAGASVTVTGAGQSYPVDRFFAAKDTSAGTFTVQQTPSATETGFSTRVAAGFTNYTAITIGTAWTAVGGEGAIFQQRIEGLNVSDFAWGTASAKTVTLSFLVYSSLTGTFSGSLTNSTLDRCYPYSYSIPVANTWTQISITIAGDQSGTWLTTNGTGIRVYWDLGSGSTFLGTANAWAGSLKLGVTGSVALSQTAGATFYITGVQLEKGSVATSFDYRPYGTELQLCQRYFEKIQPASAYQVLASGFVTSTTNGAFCLLYAVKRTSPSFTFTAGNTFVINNGLDSATTVTAISINVGRIGTQSANVHATVAAGLTQGNGCLLNANATAASCSISISAEL